jgi:signal transduction histidine kinase
VVPKDVVDEIFKYYHHLAATKQIALKNVLSPQLMIYADFEMVKFVLRNLVHNGIKFTEKDGVIECFEELSFDPKFKTIVVRDSGIGIHPEKIKLLFDINAFLSTTGTANEKGTGLGLSLAKEMMDKNGGSISVESVVGGGTTFRIELPFAE